MRAQYDRLKAAGICSQCGTRKIQQGSIRCQHCKKLRRNGQQAWREDGLCGQCGGNRGKGRLQCQRCINKSKKYRNGKPDQIRRWAREHYRRIRDECFEHYGSKCVCCGEREKAFLTFDHINNDGQRHRASISVTLPEALKREGFPDTIQILCWNCNQGKRSNGGVCPHQTN
mgnify:CR=1 FL=1